MADQRGVVIGAGPAGLTAAHELQRLGIPAVVLERDAVVGGISRTVEYSGYRFDIGGHRFFTKVPWIQTWWEEMLGSDFLTRERKSRIFYQGHFFDYPLRPVNALKGLGPIEAVRIGLSYLKVQLFPSREERTFEQWVANRFGRRLFEIFFKTYTEKVWGIPCSELGSDFAAQRIKNLDLATALREAFLPSAGPARPTTLIEQFQYPRLGPGMMWERTRDVLEARGVPVHLERTVEALVHDGTRVLAARVRDASGREESFEGTHFLSSMPLRELVLGLDPPAPPEVLAAAERLRYRDFLTVGLVLGSAEPFPDNWIYVHSPEVRVGRIQNYKRWSPDMVPDPAHSCVGLEYFVQEGDELWTLPDAELIALARRECVALGLAAEEDFRDGTVIRMLKAYPVYDSGYAEALATLRSHLETLPNLLPIGRNGQHRYNNQDHSMVTGVYAARNVAGADFAIWDVNVEAEYHEAIQPDGSATASGDRMVATQAPPRRLVELLQTAFARYDPVALGAAVGALAALGLFLSSAVLLVRGGEEVGPTLSLLGHYLPGFAVTWPKATLGAFEAGVLGFGFGYVLARLLNGVIAIHERGMRRRLELVRALRAVDGEAP